MLSNKFVLCIVEDPVVRKTKQMVLEHVGANVTAIGTVRELQFLTARSVFDLVIVGRSVGEEAKRKVADAVRRNMPKTPILEICDVSPVITGADHVLHSHDPEDLAEMVKAILQSRPPVYDAPETPAR